MSLLEELSSASFKGAEFLISSSSITGGRKDELHEFPNSDRQTIEDFGLSSRKYSIIGWIAEPNYIVKRNALLAALEDSEVGDLSHPFYGEVINLKARTFSISESLSELGRAEISMNFEVSNDIGLPVETENTLSLINALNDVVIAEANSEVATKWEVDTGFSGNFTAAQETLSLVKDSFSSASDVVSQQIDEINAFNASVSDFGNEINGLISKPQELADSIQGISSGMNALYATADSQFIAWRELFGFGNGGEISPNRTAGIIQREKNNNAIDDSMNCQSLSYGYLAASQIEYNTVNELESIAEQLEGQYQEVVLSDSIGQELRDSITDMRESVNSFFNQSRINLNRIIVVNTPELPARIISFQHYNDSSIGEEIASLNSDANVSFLEGEIQVVTQ